MRAPPVTIEVRSVLFSSSSTRVVFSLVFAAFVSRVLVIEDIGFNILRSFLIEKDLLILFDVERGGLDNAYGYVITLASIEIDMFLS